MKNDCKQELEVIYKLLQRTQRALGYLIADNGEEFPEAIDELCLESVDSDVIKVNSYIRLIFIHIFKLKYGKDFLIRDIYRHKYLISDIINFRSSMRDIIKYYQKRGKTNVIICVKDSIPDIYQDAIDDFKQIVQDMPDDYYINSIVIKNNCPYSFEDIADLSIEGLLDILN